MTQTVETSSNFGAGLGLFRLDLSCGSAWGHGGDQPSYSNQVGARGPRWIAGRRRGAEHVRLAPCQGDGRRDVLPLGSPCLPDSRPLQLAAATRARSFQSLNWRLTRPKRVAGRRQRARGRAGEKWQRPLTSEAPELFAAALLPGFIPRRSPNGTTRRLGEPNATNQRLSTVAHPTKNGLVERKWANLETVGAQGPSRVHIPPPPLSASGSSTTTFARPSLIRPCRSSLRRTRFTVALEVPASSASASCVNGTAPP